MAIGYYGQAIQGQRWVADLWGRCPAFICVLGFTATALIEGISSAGLSSEARKYTAIADGELLATGKAINFPLPKLAGGVSPALITRAIVSQLQLPLYIFNAGLLTTPPFPHIDLGGMPAQCLTTGKALPLELVKHLWEQGLAWGKELAQQHPYLILSECVVGGTTTALAVLKGLGIAADRLVGSSHPVCNHEQKLEVVHKGLAHLHSRNPLGVVSAVGDPMQIVIAGMAIAGSAHSKILLAGGSQMLAVYALARNLAQQYHFPWRNELFAIGTTRWVCQDSTSDIVRLAQLVGDVPLLASEVSFAQSRLAQLRRYEAGFVKEGVGAGASMICAHLYQNWTPGQILQAIEQLVENY